MDHQEARALLDGAGVGLDDAEVEELLARTEGWPVGLYLAALAHKAGGPGGHAWAGFTGDDRFMADYLWSELLGQLPPGAGGVPDSHGGAGTDVWAAVRRGPGDHRIQ